VFDAPDMDNRISKWQWGREREKERVHVRNESINHFSYPSFNYLLTGSGDYRGKKNRNDKQKTSNMYYACDNRPILGGKKGCLRNVWIITVPRETIVTISVSFNPWLFIQRHSEYACSVLSLTEVFKSEKRHSTSPSQPCKFGNKLDSIRRRRSCFLEVHTIWNWAHQWRICSRFIYTLEREYSFGG
jgi:hypothetical protein